jgi:hypothetical protein
MAARLSLFLFVVAGILGLAGCVPVEVDSMNPNFAGSMKLPAGAMGPSKPLGELPGSRVREGE